MYLFLIHPRRAYGRCKCLLLPYNASNPDSCPISIGRADDVIILASGEKTVPGPMEAVISGHPAVTAAIMFGRERNQVGVLVEPTPECAFDPSNSEALSHFRNEIW
jgi:acyl-coenzyme A synthetase/AMP-(fatty) acid ligase